ncbi:MAG: bifunctional folylpolyglutamate synthase/dihydrofolate synthase [Rhizobiales bacterium 32-66-8]|nr:MAG: bifunctional folylpolyglutamate synthase/dihydrofolate synthase [Rhizobiales bacterium 32-66-8]
MAEASAPGGPDAILARLTALHPKRIDLSLDRVHRLLAALGNPERRLPPVVHVAGTNGKGSTIAFLRAALEAAGQTVHVYTSPHLVRFNERIRLAGRLVEDAPLVDALDRAAAANDGQPITLFEITTVAAFLLFAEQPADVLLLEVGLGGRLDATNVVDAPIASVLTPVSIDHVEFLGATLQLIATEKAGIIKRQVPVIVGAQADEALRVIERAAARQRAPVFARGQQWTVHAEAGRLVYADDDGLLDLPLPRLMGAHQIDNAGLAVATIRAVPALRMPGGRIEEGIRAAEWPARLQRLPDGPLVARAPAGVEVWLDGGHNAAGGAVLAETMAELEDRYSRPLVLIVGMLGNKDVAGFLAPFAGLAREVIAPGDHTGLAAEDLAAHAAALGFSTSVARDVGAALDGLTAAPIPSPPRVLICGSLYLAGAILDANETRPL